LVGRHVSNALFWLVWFQLLAVLGSLAARARPNATSSASALPVRTRAIATFGLVVLASMWREHASWLVGGSAWGRPVDMAVDPSGAMLISDDQSGTIYKLTGPTTPPPGNQPPVANFTISCTAVNHSCTLDAGPSTDDGGFGNLTFSWTAPGRPTKTGKTITRYRLEGGVGNTYQETLTARDAAGLAHSVTKTVTIP
jgi:hypothetical protein